MEGTCPQCQARLELPGPGVYQCERCRARFEVSLGAPVAASPEATYTVAGPGIPPAYGPAPPPADPAPPQGAAYGPPPSYAPPLTYAPGAYPPSSAPGAPAQAPCAGHPGNMASTVCERCGDFMCRLCTTAVEGRQYCPKCFDLLYNRGALQFTQRQFTLPGVTLALGISSILIAVTCLGVVLMVPLGLGGLATGMRALKQHREQPELPNRGLTLTGLVLSGVGVVLGIGIIGFFVWATMQN
jgi:hypothetical protein